MSREFSKKKFTASCAASVAVFALVFAGAYALIPSDDMTAYASTEETADQIKVFVGDIGRAPEDYTQQRAAYIENTAVANASAEMSAVVDLDDYYTVEEVSSWAANYDITIDRVYMWSKGDTGRLILCIENNDIESSMENYKRQVEKDGSCDDPTFAADYQRFLDGEYEVFAVTVTATAEDLAELNAETDCISYVDVMYNAEVEKYAKRAGKAVSYIELPSKPDGAL